MKYLFIVNPMSGRRGADEVLVPQITAWAEQRGIDCSVEVTKYPGHATELVSDYALRYAALRVCACGGDGTISETAAGAAEKKHVALAVYPCGGGNDFVKSFCKQARLLDLNAVVEGTEIPIDMMLVGGTYCINLASVGIDADVNFGTARYRKARWLRGSIAYHLSLAEHLVKPIGKDMVVTVDDRPPLKGNYLLVAAGNGQAYGGGYRATPEARLNDGYIDVVAIKKMRLPEIVKVLRIYKKGEHIKDGRVVDGLSEKFYYRRAKRLTLSSDKEFIVNIDGESVAKKEISMEILPNALNLVIPPGVRYGDMRE